MLTTTYYCHDCQARRQVYWAPIATCTVCGCTVIDSIPMVDDEDDEDDESETEEIFIYHSNELEDDLDSEERDLLEHLLSAYSSAALPLIQHETLHAASRDRRVDENDASEDYLSTLYNRMQASESHQAQFSLTILGGSRNQSGQYHGNTLPHLKTVRLATDDPDTGEECIICQEHFSSAIDLCVLPCEHKYHSNCITRWLYVNSSCPICRSDVGEQRNEDIEQINRDIDALFSMEEFNRLI